MDLWFEGDSYPTWHKTLDVLNAGDSPKDYVYEIANQCWNWVSKQTNAKGANGGGKVVVCTLKRPQ